MCFFGEVNASLPLLSNISILDNISIVRLYHHFEKPEEVHQKVLSLLAKAGLKHIAWKRKSVVNDEMKFFAKVYRAAIHGETAIIIDRPFYQTTGNFKIEKLFNILEILDSYYNSCDIFDYTWNKERYQIYEQKDD